MLRSQFGVIGNSLNEISMNNKLCWSSFSWREDKTHVHDESHYIIILKCPCSDLFLQRSYPMTEICFDQLLAKCPRENVAT